MAQRLHDTYGFSYDKLKVLLGGWYAWQHAGYPVVLPTPAPAATGGSQTPPPLNPSAPPGNTPVP